MSKEEMTFFAVGFALIIAGLVVVVGYNFVVGTQQAASFLGTSGAEISGNPANSFVNLTQNVQPGQTIVINDQISWIYYNSTAGVTQVEYATINYANQNPAGQIANHTFGTFQGNIANVYHAGDSITLTFTVVQGNQPGSNASYVALDADWNAANSANANGYTGPQAYAIDPAYMQPSFYGIAPLYGGLGIFLAIVGGLTLFISYSYPDKLKKFFKESVRDPHGLVIGLFFILSLLVLVFLPFYPWWIVLIFSIVLAMLSSRYPQLSLLVLGVLFLAEVGYQSPELALVLLLPLIPLLGASLFDWRIGMGALFVLGLAPYGLSFVAPIFLAMVFSLLLGIGVAIAGGLLVSLFVTLGNLPLLGWLVGPSANGTPTLVNGHIEPLKPTMWMWSPLNFGTALGNLTAPNMTVLSVGSQGLSALIWSLVGIVTWCIACSLSREIVADRTKMTMNRWIMNSGVGGGAIALGALAALSAFGDLSFYALTIVLIIPATLAITAGSMIVREDFQGYFTSKLGGAAVGTRVSEMKGLAKTTFEMVGGLGDVKADIKESMIIPLMRKDVTSRFGLEPPKGILLFGPPGCGKTMLMKALANELGVEMISVKCSDLMSKWYGESENKVAELFKTAKERAPCILFMDEVDALAKRRDLYSADDVSPRLLSIMLSDMDGLDKSSGVIVVATTNKPEMIDPAMMRPGRLDKIIYVPPPDFNERTDVIKVHLFGKPVAPDIELPEIAKKTERFSGADLANLVREAATMAMKRSMMTGAPSLIAMEDFRTILPRIKPSISLRMIEEYERMKLDFERKMHQVQRAERKVVVKWDDVGGLEDVKKALREYVELPLTKPELMEEYKLKTGRGILLFGPPGCGKTHIMRAASNELNVPIQIVNGPELVSALAGQSEAAVRDILYRARENSPSIVFFDEIDALASKDSMKTPEVSRAVSQFLTEMDGIKPKDRVIIVATTNRPQILDPALLRPGRFDKIFYVPPPDLKARADIFRIQLKGIPLDGEVDVDLLSLGTEGYSGADIASIVDEAKLIALREQLRQEAAQADRFEGRSSPATSQLRDFLEKGAPAGAKKVIGVKMANLLEAIGRTKSSITPETLEWAQSFIQSYGTRA
ncbi:MAG: AAA family ATPase [Candidatus Thermoplasmatota archaeon]|jgi:SpoVK/Ycf46/Vps4 family AAA+-type ATPase|nr:AAA family ATPase [Candidatus Thermoplasmatota archaeon]